MGREILYCNKCGKLLTADDFTRGRAHTFDNRQFCTGCVPPRHDAPKTPRPAKRAPSSVRIPVAAPAAPKRSPLPWILAGAAVFAAVLGLVLLRPAPPPPPPPPEDPAVKILAEARDYARLHAKSPEDVARRWEQAVAATGGHPEAKRELDRAVAARNDAEARELKELEGKIRERLQAERFGAALDVLEEARKRHDSPEWAKAVASRVQEVKSTADRLYPDLRAKATAARAKSDTTAVAELRAKLALWGRPDLAADLEAALARIVPKEEIPAGATVLLRYPNDGTRVFHTMGPTKNGGHVAPPYGAGSVMGGFEVLKPPLEIPERGEFWLTYTTTSPKPILLRFRILRGEKTFPYNLTIETPELGRPARVKVPLRAFVNYDNKLVGVGELVQSIYIQQEDPKAELVFLEAVIFKAKD
ncbi:MAG TPA: hypothetical protein VF950_04995 [Planctomycetota bacterium]